MECRGFSLIELVVVLILVGIIAALALPRLNTGGVDSGAHMRELVAALRHAQGMSMNHTGNANYQVAITATGYNVTRGGAPIPDPATMAIPFAANWSSTTITPTGTIAFNGRGIPNCSGGLSCTGSNAQITITTAGASATFTVERFTGYTR